MSISLVYWDGKPMRVEFYGSQGLLRCRRIYSCSFECRIGQTVAVIGLVPMRKYKKGRNWEGKSWKK